MSKDAFKIMEDAEQQNSKTYENIREAAKWFHQRKGEMFERDKAEEELRKELDIEKELASEIISELLSDSVDPVINVNNSEGSFVGIAEFKKLEGAYGYIEYDDVRGKLKKVVCARCVEQVERDSEVAHVTGETESDYKELLDKIHNHYSLKHSKQPEAVKTGATLAAGSTVGGNRVATRNWVGNNYDYYNNFTVKDGDGTSTNINSGQTLQIDGGSNINTNIDSTGANTHIDVNHNNTSGQGDVSTGGATVIDDIGLDGHGHVNNLNTQNRSLDDWGNANADINLGQNNLDNVYIIRQGSADSRIRFDTSNNRIEFEDTSGNRTDVLADRIYLNNAGTWFRGYHDDLGSVNSADHHAKYTDSEARSAIEAGNVSHIDGNNSLRIRFDDSSNYVTISDHNNNREKLAVEDTYIDRVSDSNGNNWVSNHYNDSDSHHSRYSDSEARSAIEAGNVSHIDFTSGLRIKDDGNGHLDVRNRSGGRYHVEAQNYYVAAGSDNNGNNWLANHYSDGSAHHTRYSDSEARSAVDGSGINKLVLNNQEDPGGNGGLIRDNSVGFIGEWGNNGPAVLWDSYNVSAGTDINISNGTGTEGQPTISHANTSSQGDAETASATVIDYIFIDGNGHITDMNTQNRSITDWDGSGSFNADSVDGYDIQKNGTDGSGIINFKT